MKTIITFVLFVCVIFVILPTFDAVAATAEAGQTIKLIQPNEGKFLVVGKDLMTFKNEVNSQDSRDISLSVVTHPAGHGDVPLHCNASLKLDSQQRVH